MAILITRINKRNCKQLFGSPLQRLLKRNGGELQQNNLFFVFESRPGVGGAPNCIGKIIDKSNVWNYLNSDNAVFAVSPATFGLKFYFKHLTVIRDDAPGTFTGNVTAVCGLNLSNLEAMAEFLVLLITRHPNKETWSITEVAENISKVTLAQICDNLRRKITDENVAAFDLSNGTANLQLEMKKLLPSFLECSNHIVQCLYSDRPSSGEEVIFQMAILDPEDTRTADNEFERNYNDQVKKIEEEKGNLEIKKRKEALRQEAVSVKMEEMEARIREAGYPPIDIRDALERIGRNTLNTYYKKLLFISNHPIAALLSAILLFWGLLSIINMFIPLQYEIIYANAASGIDKYASSVIQTEIGKLCSDLKIPERRGKDRVTTDYKSRFTANHLNKQIRDLIEEKHADNYDLEIDTQWFKQTVRIICKGEETFLKVNIVGLDAKSIAKIKNSMKKLSDIEESGEEDSLILTIKIRRTFKESIASEIRKICGEYNGVVDQVVRNNTIKARFRSAEVASLLINVKGLRELPDKEKIQAYKKINKIFNVNFTHLNEEDQMKCYYNASQIDKKSEEILAAGLKAELKNGVVYIRSLVNKTTLTVNVIGRNEDAVSKMKDCLKKFGDVKASALKEEQLVLKIRLDRSAFGNAVSDVKKVCKEFGASVDESAQENTVTATFKAAEVESLLINIEVLRKELPYPEFSRACKSLNSIFNSKFNPMLPANTIRCRCNVSLLDKKSNELLKAGLKAEFKDGIVYILPLDDKTTLTVNVLGMDSNAVNQIADVLKQHGDVKTYGSKNQLVLKIKISSSAIEGAMLELRQLCKKLKATVDPVVQDATSIRPMPTPPVRKQINIIGPATAEEINFLASEFRRHNIQIKTTSPNGMMIEHSAAMDVATFIANNPKMTVFKVVSFTKDSISLQIIRIKKYTYAISVTLNDEVEFKDIAALVRNDSRYRILNTRHDKRSSKAVFVIETTLKSVNETKNIFHSHITQKFPDYDLRYILAREQ